MSSHGFATRSPGASRVCLCALRVQAARSCCPSRDCGPNRPDRRAEYPAHPGSHFRRRPGRLRQDDAVGAVGRAKAAARGVGIGRRPRQRPCRATDLSGGGFGPYRADPSGRVSGAGLAGRRHDRRSLVGVRPRVDESTRRRGRSTKPTRSPTRNAWTRSPNSPCPCPQGRSSPLPRGTTCDCRRPACGPRAASWRSASTILPWDDDEASSLLNGAGVDLAAGDMGDLLQETEGWPAGLYLAALAMKAGSPRAEAGFSFTGDDRYVGDYLRSEFLDRVSRAEVSFLTRTSILDRMCGPLCDATLDPEGIDPGSRTARQPQSPGSPPRPSP